MSPVTLYVKKYTTKEVSKMLSIILSMILGGVIFFAFGKIREDFNSFAKPQGMKVQAIADYLKVKFLHIPEHYKCEPINKKAKAKAV